MEKISFRRLPTVLRAQELIDMAFGGAAKTSPKVRGPPRVVAIERERRRITMAASSIHDRLSKSVVDFPSLLNLPPFYRDLADAIIGIDRLRKSLGAVDGTARIVNKLKREHLRQLRYARTPKEAAVIRRRAYGRISSVVTKVDDQLVFLSEVAKRLSNLPSVYVDMTTIVIAGYPNVGKSTLLLALTGSAPKIAHYPFTTTGLQLGYFKYSHQKYQVIDTPGLLDRQLEKRNPIERQAISALRHLAKIIVFVLDVSETCGYELRDQFHLLEDIEKMFVDINVLVVVNKEDLLDEEQMRQVLDVRPAALFITATTEEGVEDLLEEIILPKNAG